MGERNPITERLDLLYEQWRAFLDDPSGRVLRWLVDADEVAMLDTFVRLEASEGGRTEDLFMRATTPFERPHTFALELHGELTDTARDLEDGTLAAWVSPPPRTHEPAALVATCTSLCEFIRDDLDLPLDHLVLVLLPSHIVDPVAFGAWLQEIGAALVETDVRVIVMDDVRAPAIAFDPECAFVHTSVANLDMPGARVEISAQAGGLSEPPGKFRHLHTQMLNAIAASDLAAAQRFGAEAIAVAEGQGWWYLALAVFFGLGTGQLTAGTNAEAIRLFRRAEELAVARESEPDSPDIDAARNLRIKCRLGMGAAAYHAKAYAEAARVYTDTAPLARAMGDARTELDCHRMAAHCHERAAKHDAAWTSGLAAIEVGARMDEDTRRSSTLAHAGEQQLGLTKRSHFGHFRTGMQRKLDELLGPGWEPAEAHAK